MEEEVSLREYANVLLRQWKVITGITLAAVIVATLVSFLSPRVYEAQAGMLVVQPQAGTLTRGVLIDALKSNTVAAQVIEQLGDKLKPEERNPGKLLGKMQVGGQDNLFEIYVRDTDPQTAAMIANAWTKPYESSIASLYRSAIPQTVSLQAQTDTAQKDYEAKQKALEDFISSSRIDALTRQIDSDKSYISSITAGLLQSLEKLQAEAAAAKKDYEAKQKALEDFIGSSRISGLNQKINDIELLSALRSLREQINTAPSSSSTAAINHLILILLQAQSFTNASPEIQVFLQRLSGLNTSLSDVDALISMLEARIEGAGGQSTSELLQEVNQLKVALEKEQAQQKKLENARDIAQQTYNTVLGKINDAEIAQTGGQQGQTTDELQQEINQLKVELEQETAKQLGLTTSRDNAWRAYTSLASKIAGTTTAQDATVKVVQDAAVPQSPVAPRRVMNIVIALVLGLVAGICVAFVIEFFKKTGGKPEVNRDEV